MIETSGRMSDLRPGEIRIEKLGRRYRLRSGVPGVQGEDSETSIDDTGEEGGSLWSRGRRTEIWALRDVTAHIRPGERVAIVGANGSGKSTLIRILSRSLPPTEGAVEGAGIVVPFAALRQPLSAQLSGCDNLRMLARLLAIPLDQLEDRLPAIIDFSGLGKLAHEKVSRYSDQSFARLSMAMGVLVDADIYLIDDGIKDGDDVYRAKFQDRFAEVLERGASLIFASNRLDLLREYCDRAIWLEHGRVLASGEIKAVISRFLSAEDPENHFEDVMAAPREESAQPPPPDVLGRPAVPATIEPDRLEPVEDWLQATRQAESSWQTVLERWRGKRRPVDLSNIGGGLGNENCTLGAVHTLVCLDPRGQPVARILPGETLYVELRVETFEANVKVAVRLELHAKPTAIFVAEPLIPFSSPAPGQYLVRTEIGGNLLAQHAERISHKVRAIVTFGDADGTKAEQVKASVRFDVCGDIRSAFDQQQHAKGGLPTSIVFPAPALQRPDEPEIVDRTVPRPSLPWTIYRVAVGQAAPEETSRELQTTAAEEA